MALIVQKKFLETNATSAITATSAVTTGNTLVLLVAWEANTTADLTSVTDGQGRTYTVDVTAKRSGATTNYTRVGVAVAYVTGITASAAPTLTLHFSAAVVRNTLAFYELSPSTLDQTISATGSSTTPTAGSLTPAVAGSVSLAVAATDDSLGSGTAFTAGTGYTRDGQGGGGSGDSAAESQEMAGTTAVTGNWTAAATGTWFASQAIFKPSSTATHYGPFAGTLAMAADLIVEWGDSGTGGGIVSTVVMPYYYS